MEEQTKNCGAEIISDYITSVNLSKEAGKLHEVTGENTTYKAKAVVIATGASAKWLGIDAETKFNGRGVSGCATCDGPFYRNQEIAVVGGGSSAIEEALFLSNIAKKVHLIHRSDKFRSEVVLLEKAQKTENIEIHTFRQLVDLEGKEGMLGGVEKAVLKNTKTDELEKLDVTGVFIAIGRKPNTDIFKDFLTLDEIGYIEVEKGTANTGLPGVFAAGDVADPIYRQAIVSAGTGCMAALDAHRYIDDSF